MQFGKLLKEYIKKQNITIYQLAKETGIDRSFLQGVLNGTRKMPKKRFSDIVNANYFTVSQVHDLCEQYFYECFGNEKIQRFEFIEKGITGKIKEELNQEYLASDVQLKKETSFYSGKRKIADIIYAIFEKEKIENFVSNFNFNNYEINKIIYSACKKGKIKNFFHFINIDKKASVANIEAIFNSIHYAELDYITYYCDNVIVNSIMPYYIVADDFFIIYDEDGENAVLLNTDMIAPFLKEKSAEIKKQCRPMILITDNAFDYMGTVGSITAKASSNIMAGFDNQICPTFITPEIIQEIATPAVKNIPSVIQRLTSYYNMVLGKNSQNTMLNFLVVTYEAIENFVKNGELGGFPKALANPVPKEMRSHFLKALIDESNLEKLIVTNPNILKFRYDLNYQINNNYLLIAGSKGLDTPDDYNGRITYYTDIDTITNDFKDFLDYIAMSEKTYSREVSKSIVQAFIERLEAE